ncbi:hypothetical protein PINS_up008526 [Pythium insidiosum]|nr:hypothetical protein PINS_up008526 [Pythium insidiosum]
MPRSSASLTTSTSLDLPLNDAVGDRHVPFLAPAAPLDTDELSPSLERASLADSSTTTCDFIGCCCAATICPCAVVERVAWDAKLPGVFSCGFIAATVIATLIIDTAFGATSPDAGFLTIVVILSLIVGFWGGTIATSAIWLLLASQDGWRRPMTESAETLIIAVLALSILVTIILIIWHHRQQRDSLFLMEIVFACCCPCCSVLTVATKTTTQPTTTTDMLPAYAAH